MKKNIKTMAHHLCQPSLRIIEAEASEGVYDIIYTRHAVRWLADQHPTGQVYDLLSRRLSK